MPNLNLRFIFVLVVLFSLTVRLHGSEPLVEREFIRINGNLNIELAEQPAFFYSSNFSAIPSAKEFTVLDNLQSKWNVIQQSEPHWIRLIVDNKTDSVKSLILKAGQFPCDLYIYSHGVGTEWTISRIGILVLKDESLNSFYPACRIKLAPGIDTLYVYNADTWSTFSLSYLKISNEEDLQHDKSDFISTTGNLTYYLFAFNVLIAFQIIYILLQSYFHRKKEYREYLFYLTAILIYFLTRFEIYFDSNILTGNFPQLRKLFNDLMLLLPFAFYLRFARFYIEMPEKYPSMNRNVKIAEWFAFFLSGVSVFMWLIEIRDEDKLYTQLVVWLFSLYSLYLIWFFIKQRNKQIGFLLTGSLAAIIGNFLGMTLSMFPDLINYIKIGPLLFTMTGLLLEIFFFNTGLGYKAKTEHEEKLKTQETLIDQLNSNRRMQERLETMRDRIASDLHDDVGSTLSSIGLYSEVGIDQIEKNTPYVKGILEKISLSSQRLMTAMNDIVWAIHSRNDEGEGLVERIRRFSEERLLPSGIKFKLEIDAKAERFKFSMEARRNLLMIFKESINNAAKYSGTDLIRCSITTDNKSLICEINDYGKGFTDASKQNGTGMTSMKNRAIEMKGKLEIRPGMLRGTTVVIILPLSEVVLNGYSRNS